MNILITGGSGFVGNEIIKKISLNHKLTLILRKRPKTINKKIQYIITKNIFNKKKEWFCKYLKKIDMVIHCAWYVNHSDYLTSDKNIECLNGSIELSKACVEMQVKKFVGIGTCFEYDVSKKYLSINTPLKPEVLYSICKASTYLILKNIFENTKVKFKWCRLFYLYGKGEKETRLYPYVTNLLKNNKIVDIGKGDQVRDYLNIDEAAKKIIKFSFSLSSGVKNICSGKPITLKNFVLKIAKKLKKNHLVKFTKKKITRKFDPKFIVGVK
jgi:dTDP-6-deoxy-L-talose 4-dehydrogenase (NAD+)